VGQNEIFAPSWAAPFQILDIRYVEALYPKNYFRFLQNFFPDWQGHPPELASCFRGFGDFDFANPVTQRLLQLSSIRYILASHFFVAHDKVIDTIVEQNRGNCEGRTGAETFSVGGQTRATLGEHPPCKNIAFTERVPQGKAVFHFSYGISSEALDKGGDGVDFFIDVKDSRGSITPAFHNYIDPKQYVAERRWMNGQIDLSRYQGQTVTLLFSTGPGPTGDASADWAGWSNLSFDSFTTESANTFVPVYDREVKISEYDNVLPRATIYYHVDVEQNETNVLKRLADPSLDIFQSAVVNRSQLNPHQVASLALVNGSQRAKYDAGRIVSFNSQDVDIDASPTKPALLMLNDTAFPGWRVQVDGQARDWITTDYFFRGVLLLPGHHRIRFFYAPVAFRVGSEISLATLIIVVAVGVITYARSRGTGVLQRLSHIRYSTQNI
jgi:hypothetical protein